MVTGPTRPQNNNLIGRRPDFLTCINIKTGDFCLGEDKNHKFNAFYIHDLNISGKIFSFLPLSGTMAFGFERAFVFLFLFLIKHFYFCFVVLPDQFFLYIFKNREAVRFVDQTLEQQNVFNRK